MKTEKEKMLAGELNKAWDQELRKERTHARRFTRLFNETIETDRDTRRELLKELLG